MTEALQKLNEAALSEANRETGPDNPMDSGTDKQADKDIDNLSVNLYPEYVVAEPDDITRYRNRALDGIRRQLRYVAHRIAKGEPMEVESNSRTKYASEWYKERAKDSWELHIKYATFFLRVMGEKLTADAIPIPCKSAEDIRANLIRVEKNVIDGKLDGQLMYFGPKVREKGTGKAKGGGTSEKGLVPAPGNPD